MQDFQYFLNKAYGQLGYHSANAILRGRDVRKMLCHTQYLLLYLFNIIEMQHKALLLHYEQSVVQYLCIILEEF